MKKHIKHSLRLVILYGGLLAFLLLTNPTKLSIAWLIVPFVWLFVAMFYTVQLVTDVLWPVAGGHHSKRRLGVAAVCAAIPTLLLLLDSINQLTIKDVLLLTTIGGGGLLYITKLHLKKPSQ